MKERLYDDHEMALILKRATELQDGPSATSGELTLAEIQSIGSAAGIDPEAIARAARALPPQPAAPYGLLHRGPSRFQFSETLDVAIPEGAIVELIDVARQETDVEGEIAQVLDAIEWRTRGRLSETRLTVAVLQGKTRVRVAVDADQLEAVTFMAGSISGMILTLGLGTVLHVNTLPEIVAVAAGGMATTYGLLITAWRRIAQGAETRGKQLLERVIHAASELTSSLR